MVAQQLEWDGAQQGHQGVVSRVNFNDVVSDAGHLCVPFGDHGNDFSTPGFDLLDVGQHLFIVRVLGGHNENGHVFIDQRNRAVLHLGSGVPLSMDVADLFELEGAF